MKHPFMSVIIWTKYEKNPSKQQILWSGHNNICNVFYNVCCKVSKLECFNMKPLKGTLRFIAIYMYDENSEN